MNKPRNRKLLITFYIVAALIIILCSTFIWYVKDYYHAVDIDSAMSSTETVSVTATDTGTLFDGPGTTDALIFYPGAKVEPTAYAALLKKLAKSGIDCFLVNMPYNLAFFGINKADSIIDNYSYEHWYIAGHSLGGAMAASYTAKYTDELDGLILLASYSISDLSGATFPVISIYGSNDGILNTEKVASSRSLMPDKYSEYIIEGENYGSVHYLHSTSVASFASFLRLASLFIASFNVSSFFAKWNLIRL